MRTKTLERIAFTLAGLGLLGVVVFAETIHSSIGLFVATEGASLACLWLGARISNKLSDDN